MEIAITDEPEKHCRFCGCPMGDECPVSERLAFCCQACHDDGIATAMMEEEEDETF